MLLKLLTGQNIRLNKILGYREFYRIAELHSLRQRN